MLCQQSSISYSPNISFLTYGLLYVNLVLLPISHAVPEEYSRGGNEPIRGLVSRAWHLLPPKQNMSLSKPVVSGKFSHRFVSSIYGLVNIVLSLLYYVIDYHKPKGRSDHSSVVIGNKLYNWGGDQDGLPKVHSSEKKRKFLSNIDVLHLDTGMWRNEPITGYPHPGVNGYACIAVENKRKLFFFGGYCGHDDCYHNNISQLDPDTLIWSNVVGGDHQRDGPMKKFCCGIMSFSSEGEDHLFITGGLGPPPNNPQPNAEYSKDTIDNKVITNEQHIYNINTGKSIHCIRCM